MPTSTIPVTITKHVIFDATFSEGRIDPTVPQRATIKRDSDGCRQPGKDYNNSQD